MQISIHVHVHWVSIILKMIVYKCQCSLTDDADVDGTLGHAAVRVGGGARVAAGVV